MRRKGRLFGDERRARWWTEGHETRPLSERTSIGCQLESGRRGECSMGGRQLSPERRGPVSGGSARIWRIGRAPAEDANPSSCSGDYVRQIIPGGLWQRRRWRRRRRHQEAGRATLSARVGLPSDLLRPRAISYLGAPSQASVGWGRFAGQ